MESLLTPPSPERIARLVKYVRYVNVLTAVVQVMAGVGNLARFLRLDVASTFIAIYVILFALLLLVFEFRQPSSDALLRANFGFLYSFRGLSAYLFFMGCLNFGMTRGVFGYVAGAFACLSAVVVLCASCYTSGHENEELEAAINKADPARRVPTYGSSGGGAGTHASTTPRSTSGTPKAAPAPTSFTAKEDAASPTEKETTTSTSPKKKAKGKQQQS
ncbi:hypothetical protein PINS_up010514 [Pythium insidiosum]|nr:hypothetical protein PINS_up010514 [Pythium insidiosum]